MYRLEREEFVQTPYVSLWSGLGFQAGFLNAFGFLACGRYVSHVTGMGTQMGVALAEQRPWFAFELMGFPLMFILGAFLSGFFTISRIEQGLKPRYGLVTFLLPMMILGLLVAGTKGAFGVFGEDLLLARDFVLVYALCFVCGMQNGCFATLTKGQIRTTHLTGISTDIGTDFARMWFGKLEGKERALTLRTNISRIATFVSFALGSITSVLVSRDLGYGALVVPLFTSVVGWYAVQSISHGLDKRFGVPKDPEWDALVAAMPPTSNVLPAHDPRSQLA
jgi:uncharacterized membrane protein YoaK (UPF0700 family)